MSIKFNHKTLDSGEMVLTDFRYITDDETPVVVCELDGDELCWNTQPSDERTRKYVEKEFQILKREIAYNNYRIGHPLPEPWKSPWHKREIKKREAAYSLETVLSAYRASLEAHRAYHSNPTEESKASLRAADKSFLRLRKAVPSEYNSEVSAEIKKIDKEYGFKELKIPEECIFKGFDDMIEKWGGPRG